MWNTCKRFTALFVSTIIPFAAMPVYRAHAEPVPTEYFLAQTTPIDARQKLIGLLARDEVVLALVRHGVNVSEARERIEALSDQETEYLAGAIENLPAGADGVGSVVGAIVLIFVILLVTDILGLTKVFPFTRSVR